MADNYYTGNEVLNNSYNPLTKKIEVSANVVYGGTRVKTAISQDLSIAPLSFKSGNTNDFFMRGIILHVTDGAGNEVPIMEDVKIILDESDDNFDTPIVIESFVDQDGNPTASLAFFPDSDIMCFGSTGSDIRVEVTNNNLTGIVNAIIYLEVV